MKEANTEIKTLQIIKDCTPHTSYVSMNTVTTKFFEGKAPLSQAKKWAKENGYNQVLLISSKFGVDNKIYKIK